MVDEQSTVEKLSTGDSALSFGIPLTLVIRHQGVNVGFMKIPRCDLINLEIIVFLCLYAMALR